jgi:hypothetical protein
MAPSTKVHGLMMFVKDTAFITMLMAIDTRANGKNISDTDKVLTTMPIPAVNMLAFGAKAK